MENDERAECPICKQSSVYANRTHEWVTITCPNCGCFKISERAELEINHQLGDDVSRRAIVSHVIRKQQLSKTTPKLTTRTLSENLRAQLPTVQEQANNLLTFLAESAGEIGVSVSVVLISHWTALCGAKSEQAVEALISFLIAKNFVKEERPITRARFFSVTFEGWIHYEELQNQNSDSTIAFMAMKFGDPELDQVVDEFFRPAVLQTGFRLQKLTDEQRAGLIDDQLRVQIRRARILIADLTHANNGAYWEAGFAEGLGIAVIYTCKESEFKKQAHFDTNHHLTVMWNPDKPEEAAEKLKATIRATLPEVAKMEDRK